MVNRKLNKSSDAASANCGCFAGIGDSFRKSFKLNRSGQKREDKSRGSWQEEQQREFKKVDSFPLSKEAFFEEEHTYDQNNNIQSQNLIFPITIHNKQQLKEVYDAFFSNNDAQTDANKQQQELFIDTKPAPSSRDSDSRSTIVREDQSYSPHVPTPLPQFPNPPQSHNNNNNSNNMILQQQHNNAVIFRSDPLLARPQPQQRSQEEAALQEPAHFGRPYTSEPNFPRPAKLNLVSEKQQEVVPFKPLSQQEVDIKSVRQTGQVLNKFALNLNRVLYTNGNCVFSPFSIFNALGLVIEATQNDTQIQILKMLDLNLNSIEKVRNNYYNFISNILFTHKKSFKLFSANRFYANSNVKFQQNYKNTLRKYYNADSVNADFSNKLENERQNINSWVEKVTQDQIQDLLPCGSVSSMSVAVLVNALYFEGSWDEVFDPENNEMRDFRTKKGEVKKVETMVLKQLYFRVQSDFSDIETDIKCVSVKLPYDNGAASFHVVLPLYDEEDNNDMDIDSSSPKKHEIERLLEDLDEENLESILKYGDEEMVDIYLPKFSVEFATTMSEPLKNLGMTDAFDPSKANFGGMVDKNNMVENLFITEGFHKTKITVNETGTVAASAMAIGVARGSPPQPRQFEVNRPFLFLVVHESTRTILFSGVVDDPTLG